MMIAYFYMLICSVLLGFVLAGGFMVYDRIVAHYKQKNLENDEFFKKMKS